MEDGALPKNPNMHVAQLRYVYTLEGHPSRADHHIRDQILAAISADEMAPYYLTLCEQFGWMVDDAFVDPIKTANAEKLAALEAAIKAFQTIVDAVENQGESEIREALLNKAEYLSRIGTKSEAVAAFTEAFEKTVSLGQRLDLVFNVIRVGFFHDDLELVRSNIAKANGLMEQGGDWDRRNRLKVYNALVLIVERKFAEASKIVFECISTFTCTELMEYNTFVQYAVLLAMLAFDRTNLKKKVVSGAEIQDSLYDQPLLKQYINSFYKCNYDQFLVALAGVEAIVQGDRYWGVHTRYYIREMRIRAYAQLLESYQSVTLQSLSKSFGVSEEFIDKELARFIAAGRLNCKIDRVGKIVETNRPDKKNAQYQATIKQGDVLLNRLQKLGRVIDN